MSLLPFQRAIRRFVGFRRLTGDSLGTIIRVPICDALGMVLRTACVYISSALVSAVLGSNFVSRDAMRESQLSDIFRPARAGGVFGRYPQRVVHLAAAIFAIALFAGRTTAGATYSWQVSSGDWSVAANWGSVAPTGSDLAYVSNGGTASITQVLRIVRDAFARCRAG